MSLMSMRQYAKHRGVSTEAVSKAVKAGRITCKRNELGHALIDPEIADREWQANTDPAKFRTSGVDNREPLKQAQGAVPRQAAPVAEEKESSDKVGDAYRGSKAIREAFQAKLAKLDFDERSGKLHDVEECRALQFKIGRSVRDALMNIPDRLSAELAAEADPFKVNVRLKDEIRKALESLKELSVESKSQDV